MDSTADDFERGSWREYILGRGPIEPDLPAPQVRVRNSQRNDPRAGFQLDTANLNSSPVYVRFEPSGSNSDWNLSAAVALVYTGAGQIFTGFDTPTGFHDLWLGDAYGKIVFLKRWDI